MAADPKAARREWARVRYDRETTVVERLRRAATTASEPAEASANWLALERQCARYLGASARGGTPDATAHARRLEAAAGEAAQALDVTDSAAVAAGRQRLGLRVALVGKGGAGKSMIAATLARQLARRGRPVLAADLDTNPGLAYSLGTRAGGLLGDADLQDHEGAPYGVGLRAGADPHDVGLRHAAHGPDGVRFLSVGKISAADKAVAKRTITATSELLTGFGEPGWDVVGDLEAGPSTPFMRYHEFADIVVVVVTPTWVSALTARRLLPIVDRVPVVVVGNGYGDEPEHPGLQPLLRIPHDPAVAEAERLGLAPLDHCPDAPAVAAVGRLAERLTNREVPV